MRSGEYSDSCSRLTLAHAKPAVIGWSGSPCRRSSRPSSTWARSEHWSGQSWAHAVRTVLIGPLRARGGAAPRSSAAGDGRAEVARPGGARQDELLRDLAAGIGEGLADRLDVGPEDRLPVLPAPLV